MSKHTSNQVCAMTKGQLRLLTMSVLIMVLMGVMWLWLTNCIVEGNPPAWVGTVYEYIHTHYTSM